MKALLISMMLCAGVASAQEDFGKITFHFVRPGLPVPDYTFLLNVPTMRSFEFALHPQQSPANGIVLGSPEVDSPVQITGYTRPTMGPLVGRRHSRCC